MYMYVYIYICIYAAIDTVPKGLWRANMIAKTRLLKDNFIMEEFIKIYKLSPISNGIFRYKQISPIGKTNLRLVCVKIKIYT